MASTTAYFFNCCDDNEDCSDGYLGFYCPVCKKWSVDSDAYDDMGSIIDGTITDIKCSDCKANLHIHYDSKEFIISTKND